jgi:hypothetical protein
MSVRATERLIGEIVVVTELPNSPKMVVQAVDTEEKLITTVWFSDTHVYQEGFFPASAIDRAAPAPAPAPAKKGKAPARKR